MELALCRALKTFCFQYTEKTQSVMIDQLDQHHMLIHIISYHPSIKEGVKVLVNIMKVGRHLCCSALFIFELIQKKLYMEYKR